MNLTGRSVRFRLSPEGREALNEVTSATEYVDGLVVDENHLGVWVWLPQLQTANTVVLLTWEGFSTAIEKVSGSQKLLALASEEDSKWRKKNLSGQSRTAT